MSAIQRTEGTAMKMNSKIFPHLMKLADDLRPKLAWSARTPAEHRAWRKRFKARLTMLLGRKPQRVPLQVHWAEEVETDLFTRHKIYVRSERHYWVPAYYFVPKDLKAEAPAIVCIHGHSGILPYIREGDKKQREMARVDAVDYAVFFAENGYITIAPVQRGWNETSGPRGCERMAMDCFLIGMTPAGLRCWDASRLIDFLKAQDKVDASQIGVAGLSGGGKIGMYLAAIEDRVKLAMIAGYYCTFRDSIYEIEHCICNCIPHIMEWGDMSDVAALFAPRPLLVISGTRDSIFPIKATRKAYRKLAETYGVLGAKSHLEKDFFEGPHAWSNRKTLTFLSKHFGAAAGGVIEPTPAPQARPTRGTPPS